MGDRCYFEIWCKREDAPKFEALGFQSSPDDDQPPGPAVKMFDEEANYAHYQAMPTDCVWEGWSGAGGCYDASRYACDGKQVFEVHTGMDGDGAYIVLWDDAIHAPSEDSLLQIRQYLEAKARGRLVLFPTTKAETDNAVRSAIACMEIVPTTNPTNVISDAWHIMEEAAEWLLGDESYNPVTVANALLDSARDLRTSCADGFMPSNTRLLDAVRDLRQALQNVIDSENDKDDESMNFEVSTLEGYQALVDAAEDIEAQSRKEHAEPAETTDPTNADTNTVEVVDEDGTSYRWANLSNAAVDEVLEKLTKMQVGQPDTIRH